MLKAEFHIHIDLDPKDNIKYNYKQLIDRAAALKYDVLAITCHDKVVVNSEMQKYAESKNILLISGAELTIQKKHVLVYNVSEEERIQIKSFEDLKKLKQIRKDILILAAHPFYYGSSCLKNIILKYLDLFDAWEYSFFYHQYINPNRKVFKLSQRFKKPLLGNSDLHNLKYLGKTYTLIQAKKSQNDIFKAIKAGKVQIITNSLSNLEFLSISFWVISSPLRNHRNPTTLDSI